MIPERISSFLDEHGTAYRLLSHRPDTTARETAIDTTTPLGEFAKSVVMRIDGKHAIIVLAASEMVDLSKAREVFGTHDVHLVEEETLQDLFPDCELGAEPPLGNLYGLPVYVSPMLSRDQHITFNAGTHTEAMRMSYEDFNRLTEPKVVDVASSATQPGSMASQFD